MLLRAAINRAENFLEWLSFQVAVSGDLLGAQDRPYLFFDPEKDTINANQLNAIVFLSKLKTDEPSEKLCWFIEACRCIRHKLLLPKTLEQVLSMIEKGGRFDIFDCLAANGYLSVSCPELPSFAAFHGFYGILRHSGRLPDLSDKEMIAWISPQMFLELLDLGLPLTQPLAYDFLTRNQVIESDELTLPKRLLQWGADPDDRSHKVSIWNPHLIIDSTTNYPQMVNAAEVYETALELALRRRNPAMAKLLLSYGAQISEVKNGDWRKQAWALVRPTFLVLLCGMAHDSVFSIFPEEILQRFLRTLIQSYYKR